MVAVAAARVRDVHARVAARPRPHVGPGTDVDLGSRTARLDGRAGPRVRAHRAAARTPARAALRARPPARDLGDRLRLRRPRDLAGAALRSALLVSALRRVAW